MEAFFDMKGFPTTHHLAAAALVAAVYAALTLATAFMSFGAVQFRIAEALCILPFFFPFTTWGVFLGCLLANLLSPIGAPDIILGSLTTLAACLCIAGLDRRAAAAAKPRWGRCVAVCLIPTLFNALAIGWLLTLYAAQAGDSAPRWLLFAGNAASVGLGEAVVMFVLGLPLLRWLPGSRLYGKLREGLDRQK